jgi:hypothetical protein
MGLILTIFLILLVLGVLPRWPHSRERGYALPERHGLALLIVIILLLPVGCDHPLL